MYFILTSLLCCYLNVSFSRLITSVGEASWFFWFRLLVFLLCLFEEFFFLWVLGEGCVILSCHSLGLPYFVCSIKCVRVQSKVTDNKCSGIGTI